MRTLLAILVTLTALPLAAQTPPPFAAFDLAGPPVLNDPHDLDLGPDGRLYVADKFGSRIAVLDPETLELVEVIGAGLLPGVHDVSFGPDGRAAVAVTGLGAVFVYDDLAGSDGKPTLILPAASTEGALMHSNGRVYAMASGYGTIIAYDGDTAVAFAQGHPGAHDIDEGPDGSIWIADNFNRQVVKYSPELEKLQTINHARFGFAGPRYLDVDASGLLVVADQDAHRVLLIDPDAPDGGALLGVLGTGLPGDEPGQFDDPEGALVIGSRYYFADSDNNRIVRYTIVMN